MHRMRAPLALLCLLTILMRLQGDDQEDRPPAGADLAPGAWDFCLEMGDEVFPSWIVATAAMKWEWEVGPEQLGDPAGAIGIVVRSPKDDCPIEVEVSSANILRPTRFKGTLAKKDGIYYVNPQLDFDYATLASVKQPFPENIRAVVTIDGKAPEERLTRVTVKAINDCVWEFVDAAGEEVEVPWTIAAFVNENHPICQTIMAEARDADGNPMSFSSYQGSPEDVVAEIAAIWAVLRARGVRYSSIITPSMSSAHVLAQYVRRPGEAIETEQANCVDGTVLLASILRRMELDVYLISVPDHMFLGVKLEEDDDDETTLDELTGIETTLISDADLEDAIEEGNRQIQEYAKALAAALASEDGASGEVSIVSVEEARKMGVLPIPEP